MARTTADAVRAVLLSDYGPKSDGTDPSLEPFIDTASLVVDEIVGCAARKSKTLTDARLGVIECWLAAHFYSVSDRPFETKSTDRARAKFQGKTGMYLESSHYGQTAKTLDTSGCLSAMDGGTRRTAGATWMGKRPDDATDYHDR